MKIILILLIVCLAISAVCRIALLFMGGRDEE